MPRPATIAPPGTPLSRALALTRAGMMAERAARAFWLPLSLILLAATAAAFGLPALLPPGWVQGVGALAALAPGADVAGALAPLLRQWQSAGLVALDGDVVRLTTAGRFWYSNLVFAFDAILCAGAGNPMAGGPQSRPTFLQNQPKTRELS